ncbi:MAG TPA: AAA family ATPase [Kineosporiaceae bacterium]|nr:AAA family ATPase [Kineosporiaceae bacterium]
MPVEPHVSGHLPHTDTTVSADSTVSADTTARPGSGAGPARPAGTGDPLEAERGYLARARADLARMRERTLALKVQGGDPVSAEYLAATLHHRAAALVDDPSTTLFFGRTDHEDGARWYVGRRHVADAAGDPVVIDWRAEVSRAFYRASRAEPMGVARRRRFGIEHGVITAYEDEHLTDVDETDRRSEILAREIERPRVGPMRDIVATIQPEQDEIVRAGVGTSICVQGAPGTGKTAVGLHRAAWLLYAFRERLGRSGVLVVGPNSSFLEHVGAVLPSLGEAEVRHTTVEALVGVLRGARQPRGSTAAVQVRVRGQDEVGATMLKGDARMAAVLRAAVWSHLRRPTEALILPRGSRRWRLPAYRITELVEELRARGVRYAAARDMLPQRLAHALLMLFEEAGDSPDDRVQDAVARSREVRAYTEAVWPALDPAKVLFRLYAEPDFLTDCARDLLTPDEQRLLLWTHPPRSTGSARWTAADAVLLDELADLLRRTPSLGHVILDEAQDLSAMQLRAVGRRCSTGSVTVLGDLAQGTTPWATPSWADTLAHLGQPGAVIEELSRGFRVPSAVIDYAARLLPLIAEGLTPPSSVREDPGTLDITAVPAAALWTHAVAATRRALEHEGSVGLIVPDALVQKASRALTRDGIRHLVLGGERLSEGTGLDLVAEQFADGLPAEGLAVGDATGSGASSSGASSSRATGSGAAEGPVRVWVVPATTAKGLEYDHVVALEPAAMAEAEPDERTGLRRLYVVLTRAVTGLEIVHSRPLPGPLSEPVAS